MAMAAMRACAGNSPIDMSPMAHNAARVRQRSQRVSLESFRVAHHSYLMKAPALAGATRHGAMDTELVNRAQKGDQAAFAEIASATYGRLHSLAYGILRDRALAEDAVQHAMLAAWRNLPKLCDPARFDAWANRMTVNARSRDRHQGDRPAGHDQGQHHRRGQRGRAARWQGDTHDHRQLHRHRRCGLRGRGGCRRRHHGQRALRGQCHRRGRPRRRSARRLGQHPL